MAIRHFIGKVWHGVGGPAAAQHQNSPRPATDGSPPVSLRDRRQRDGRPEYPLLGFEDEEAARQAVNIVEDFTMCSYERLVTLWLQVRHLDRAGVTGSLVECGTWRGGACGMMVLAHKQNGFPTRAVHLFDSFEGLPEPDEAKDGAYSVKYAAGRATGALESIGACVGSLDDNKRLLHTVIGYPERLAVYHVGWFQQTVPAAAASLGPIALLRLDGDWYESTRVCLEHLYPLVSPGGVVVIDDYGKWAGCRRAVDEFMQRLPRRLFLNRIDGPARYLLIPGP